LHEHHDADGDASQARAVAQAEQSAHDEGRQYGQDEVPRQNAKERKPETEGGTDQGSQDAVARCGDGGAEVRLQHNDGADGSPVAVPEAESQRDPPTESSGQGGSRGVDQKPLALPVQQALRSNSTDAQFNRELLLRPRFGFR
jgi:hypothetical protein